MLKLCRHGPLFVPMIEEEEMNAAAREVEGYSTSNIMATGFLESCRVDLATIFDFVGLLLASDTI